MALSASGTKRDETKKDTKRTCRKHQKIIDKELINKLPRDIILIISKMHPLLIPPFTNDTLRRAVKDYLDGGDRKKRIVEKYGEISNWDTSKVTNMYGLFKGATSFNQPLNNWDVECVEDMSHMFSGATSFNQPLNNWDVWRVTNMSFMFKQATSFNQPLNWDVINVTNIHHMFWDANSFNQPLNNWEMFEVCDMRFMFFWASSFNQPLNKWNAFVKGAHMSYMFSNATSFNQPLHAPWHESSDEDESDPEYESYYSE